MHTKVDLCKYVPPMTSRFLGNPRKYIASPYEPEPPSYGSDIKVGGFEGKEDWDLRKGSLNSGAC